MTRYVLCGVLGHDMAWNALASDQNGVPDGFLKKLSLGCIGRQPEQGTEGKDPS